MSWDDEGRRSDLVDIACERRHETEKAILIFDGTKEVWLAKSQCEFYPDDGIHRHGIVAMPEWLAIEKELV